MKSKIETLSFRINPVIKQALREIAKKEHRSLSNMVEHLILKYCKENKIKVNQWAD